MPRRKLRNKTPLLTQALLGPGFRGLNTELAAAAGENEPTWALTLNNAVWDDRGLVSLRKGYVVLTTVPIAGAPSAKVVHEYLRADGTTEIIVMGSDFAIYSSTDDGSTFSAITGALVTTTTDWKFVNFNGNVYATASGNKVWEYTGTGTFTEIADSPVTRGVILAAFGRLWAARDGSSAIDYSALLGGATWTGSGTGAIDTANVWTQGYDEVRGLAAFGSTFVVFGREHIILYVDGSGSVLGIDPNNMYVVDTIEGTGTEFRDAIVNIGDGDLWFVSAQGVQSLARVIQDKTNPLVDVSANIRGLVQNRIFNQTGEVNSVQAIFSPEEQFCLFLFTGTNEIIHFDTQLRLEDGTYRASVWTDITDRESFTVRRDGTILYGLTGGEVAKYSNYRDDAGGADTKYDLVYATPWVTVGEHNKLKIIKGFYGHFYGQETLTATARWAVDFRPLEFAETFLSDFDASGGEFGSGEFGNDEFADGYRFRRQYTSGAGEGQFVQLWLTIESTDVDAFVAIQEVGIMAKLGRQV